MEKYDPLAINYKMDTLEDILSIPVPTEKFELPDVLWIALNMFCNAKPQNLKKREIWNVL